MNLAALKTSGVDVQIAHSFDIAPGALRTNAAIGWLNAYDEQGLPGDALLDFAGTIGGSANRLADNDIHPEWRINVSSIYELGKAAIGAR